MDDVIEHLAEMGLSNYEARAYWVLVDQGPTTAEDVATEADIPMGRIYDVLNSLNDRSLVRHDDGRPRTYVPVAGDRAVSQLLEERLTDLEQRQERYESTADDLEAYLETVDQAQPEQSFATSAFHREGTIDLLGERLETATDEVRIAAGSIQLHPELRSALADQLLSLLNQNVDVSFLAGPEAEFTDAIDELRSAGLDLRISVEAPDQRFFVIDDREVVLEVFHPITADGLLAGVNFRDEAITADLSSAFDDLWVEADRW